MNEERSMTERAVRMVRPGDRVPTDLVTPGMHREQAFAGDGVWAGTVRTEPGVVTGWHHHGAYDTVIYVLSGEFRLEWGPGGNRADEGGAGTFFVIPAGEIHREASAGADGVEAVLFRVGSGDVVINTDGPASS
jgi:uncharacterized RmlC-like cupin family protein